jgi:hypothetical protein
MTWWVWWCVIINLQCRRANVSTISSASPNRMQEAWIPLLWEEKRPSAKAAERRAPRRIIIMVMFVCGMYVSVRVERFRQTLEVKFKWHFPPMTQDACHVAMKRMRVPRTFFPFILPQAYNTVQYYTVHCRSDPFFFLFYSLHWTFFYIIFE